MAEELPPPVDAEPALKPVLPPPGSPDYERKMAAKIDVKAGAKGEAAAGGAETEPQVAAPAEVAAVTFTSDRTKSIPLSSPFEWGGKRYEGIVLRRLLMADVDRLVEQKRHDDLYEVYAEMTGLPAAVLRGMDADDGEALMEAGADFLPRSIRKAFGFSSA